MDPSFAGEEGMDRNVAAASAVMAVLFVLLWPVLPGYTLSLSIWAVPVVLMTVFLHGKSRMTPLVRKALWVSLGSIAVLGSFLDLIFAKWFFVFPNPKAVLGVHLRQIPVEEFAFYLLGGWFLGLSYVFGDEYWLLRYNRPDHEYRRWSRRIPSILSPSGRGWVLLVSTAVGAVAFKAWRNPGGLPVPGYFLFLLVLAYAPFVLFERAVGRFVNWRAFSLTLSVTLGVSIVWEVTLAIPLGWWGYQDGAMLGVFVQPWNRLPLEAVTVWVFSSFAILIYEAAKMFLHRRAGI